MRLKFAKVVQFAAINDESFKTVFTQYIMIKKSKNPHCSKFGNFIGFVSK